MHELPLLIFTLFLQGSVGVTLWLALARPRATAEGVGQRAPLPGMLGAFAVAGVGLMASALHMGYPLNALNALRHFSSSWLSREIIFASLYLAALAAGIALAWLRHPGWKALLPLAALCGVVDVYCMAQIYMHASVITWRHFNTLLLFIGSMGILGAVAVAPAALRGALRRAPAVLPGAAVVVAILVLARLLAQPLWLADIAAADPHSVTFPHAPLLMLQQLRPVYLVGWCASGLGMLSFVCGGMKKSAAALIAGGALLVIGELMLRFVFFSIG